MNIVIHRYNSICEPGYIEAFKSLGVEVIEDDLEMREKNIPADVRISTLGELILRNKPMFVFSINFFPYISEICEKLGVLYVCVSVDCPVAELWSTSVRNRCNRIFLFDRCQYEEVVNENPDGIFHLPLGVNPLITPSVTPDAAGYRYDISFIGSLYSEKNPYTDIAPSLNDRLRGICDGLLNTQEILGGMDLLNTVVSTKYDSEICTEVKSGLNKYLPKELSGDGFIVDDMTPFWAVHDCFGFELTVRDRTILLASLAESIADTGSLHIFTGSDTSHLKSLAPGVITHGRVKTLGEMPDVFALSRININTTMRSIRTGLPQRIWDVLGCGGFLLTDAQAEIPEYLVPGEHLAVYGSVEEACELAAYYLTHEDERREIAGKGLDAVRKEHMIFNRVAAMVSAIMGEET